MASNADLERAFLWGAGSPAVSLPDIRFWSYGQQTPQKADPTTGRSAIDVEMAALRTASVNPLKDQMSLADLRRDAWDG